MEKSISHVLHYFAQFAYPPTEEEIFRFLPEKVKKELFHAYLAKLVKQNHICEKMCFGKKRYQTYAHLGIFESTYAKLKRGEELFGMVKSTFWIFRMVPAVKYMGISGSLSMKHVSDESDIDIFTITSQHTIWQTRFILLCMKRLLIIISPNIGNKLCFNLFFAENGLLMRKNKQNEYVGHELLQLRTIVNKDQIYKLLFFQNRWIVNYFPNVQIKSISNFPLKTTLRRSYVSSVFEKIAKKIQIWWLRRKKYQFSDFGAQVWFIQEDFEKKMKDII